MAWNSTKKTVQVNCKMEEVKPGRFVKKCEKIEQIVRESNGRPAVVVESKTEYIEEDVTDEVFESPENSVSVEQEVTCKFGSFMEAAVLMAKMPFKLFEFVTSEPPSSTASEIFTKERTESADEEARNESFNANDALPGEVEDV